jgi:hypothetical protein
MTKDQVKEILDRVLTWPPERQEDAAQMLLMLEAEGSSTYRPSEDEWAAIQEGLEEAKRGEFASDEDVAAFWKPRDR